MTYTDIIEQIAKEYKGEEFTTPLLREGQTVLGVVRQGELVIIAKFDKSHGYNCGIANTRTRKAKNTKFIATREEFNDLTGRLYGITI